MRISKIYHIIQISVLVAIMAILSYIEIPIGPVPIVLENFGVMLASLLLGAKRGTVAVILFIIIRMLGIGGPGGLILLVSPVSGYIYGWLLIPALVTLFIKIFHAHNWFIVFIIMILMSVVLDDFVFGSIGLIVATHMTLISATIYNLSFVIGDLIKAFAATIVYIQVTKSSHFSELLK